MSKVYEIDTSDIDDLIKGLTKERDELKLKASELEKNFKELKALIYSFTSAVEKVIDYRKHKKEHIGYQYNGHFATISASGLKELEGWSKSFRYILDRNKNA